jgi:cold shock protein
MKPQRNGSIKYVNTVKGFGFITPDITGTPDVCFFFDQLRGNAARVPLKGERVVYEEGIGKKGPIATTVYVLADEQACQEYQADLEAHERFAAQRRKAALDQIESTARLIARNAAWHAARKGVTS